MLEFLDNDMLSIFPMVFIIPYIGLNYIFPINTMYSLMIVFAIFILILELVLVYKKKVKDL